MRRSWIGLLQPPGTPLPDAGEPYPLRLKSGSALVVVGTQNADARCARAAAMPGATMTRAPRLQVYPGRAGGAEIRVRGCNVFDPDGIAVENNQLIE